MSYDLIFLRKRPDQSWSDIMDALESENEPEDAAGIADAAAWQRILTGARTMLADVSAEGSDDCFELTDEQTNIQISLYATEASISAPYWYRGAHAESIARTMYALGALVEAATGFEGYDAQLDLPIADAALDPGKAATCFDQVADSFTQRDISSPTL